MLRQRVYGIALGCEDLNDEDTLRHDPAWQTGIGKDEALASNRTVCRFKNRAERRLKKFIAHHKEAPEERLLDLDLTEDPVHGNQEGGFFHGYYGQYCFLPLYVTCGDWVLASYLRWSNIDRAKHSLAILSLLVRLLVRELHRVWPKVRIIFRGDGGFCHHRMSSWCERNDVQDIVGIAKNNRFLQHTRGVLQKAEGQFVHTGEKQRLFGEFLEAADTWSRERRVIVTAEYSEHGPKPCFIATNPEGDP